MPSDTPSTDNIVGADQPIATGSLWDQVRGSFVVDGVLFAGWADATMTAQTFDGQTLGGQVAVTLRHAFNDLPQVGAMFFDRTRHRLYYTHAGSDRLYYRYFTPESRIVGTWRYPVTGASSIDWGRVGAPSSSARRSTTSTIRVRRCAACRGTTG